MRGFEKAIVWALFGAAVAAIGLGGYRMALDSRGIVIGSDEGAPWIAVAEPVTASIRQWRIDDVPRTRFATAFVSDSAPGPVELTFRALGNATLPFALALADHGWRKACAANPHLLAGLNTHAGRLTYAAVGAALGIDSLPVAEALKL